MTGHDRVSQLRANFRWRGEISSTPASTRIEIGDSVSFCSSREDGRRSGCPATRSDRRKETGGNREKREKGKGDAESASETHLTRCTPRVKEAVLLASIRRRVAPFPENGITPEEKAISEERREKNTLPDYKIFRQVIFSRADDSRG